MISLPIPIIQPNPSVYYFDNYNQLLA